MTDKPNQNVTTATPPSGPQSEDDWTIHSLNIHGLFFERWCQHIVGTTPPWELTTTNYPVEVTGHQSSLDIRADFATEQSRLILLIECKKNNPDFVNWVFFPRYRVGQSWATPLVLLQIRTAEDSTVNSFLEEFNLPFMTADDARETRGNYLGYSKQKSDKTRTANSAITEAASQIALATSAILAEERHRAMAYVRATKPRYHPNTTILPIIVTSAEVFTCEFSPTDVNPVTGEVPYENVKLTPASYVVYEYPLPRHFLGPVDDALVIEHSTLDIFLRRHIIVVQAKKLSHFLRNHALNLITR
jgi:hypothetical protein